MYWRRWDALVRHQLPPDSGIRWLGCEPRHAEKECDSFFVGGRARIHRAMYTGIRFVPTDHTRVHGNPNPLSCITELNGEVLTAHDDGEAMAGIGMPRHRLSRLEDEPTNHEVVAPRDDFCLHCVVPTSFGLPNGRLHRREPRESLELA